MSCEVCKNYFSIQYDKYNHTDCDCGGEAKFCPECGEPLTESQPLTLEQLREMDGQPVYIRLGDGDQFWALVTVDNGELGLLGECYDHECPDKAFYGMIFNDPAGHFGLHVLGWLAYTRKPERDGK